MRAIGIVLRARLSSHSSMHASGDFETTPVFWTLRIASFATSFARKWWIIPTARLKQRRTHPEPHLVPLSDQVLGILKELHQITGPDGFVFPSARKGRPLSENAFRVALLNLGYDGNTHHAHGFRKLASTRLHALNFDSRIIEKQLAHAVPGVAGKYNTYDYAAERRDMLQSWSDHLDGLRTGDNVVAISSAPRR